MRPQLLAAATHHVYCDTEYREDGRQPILAVFHHREYDEWVEVDLRQSEARHTLLALIRRWNDAYWLAYAAHAEISTLLTLGLDVRDMAWIDLAAEAKQITASHAKYYLDPRDTNLLSTLDRFGIAHDGDTGHKNRMRNLILASDQYSEAEWAAICRYCRQDIEPLPALWEAILDVHAITRKVYSEHTGSYHGEYSKAVARLEHPSRSRGFPVDELLMDRIYDNRTLVMQALAEDANATYGNVFTISRQTGEPSFSFKGLLHNLEQQPGLVEWEVTKSGRLRMDEEYLDEFVKQNPYYKPLQDAKALLHHFSRADPRHLIRDGFIKGVSLPFHTVTGRNQPKASRGFLLAMRPWLRQLIRPQPQHVLIACDWSQQEIVIAAALSGDPQLIAALQSGDTYMAIAQLAEAVPPEATADTHPIQRALYKAVQLGLSYGMRDKTLGKTIYADLRQQGWDGTVEEAAARAREILAWHQQTFVRFWSWSRQVVEDARRSGYLRSFDGWTRFCTLNSSSTKLGNFPCQAGGAVIMREAIKLLADHNDIEFTCSFHDALYCYAHQDDADHVENTMRRCMAMAVDRVMQCALAPLPITVKATRYTHETGYTDKRDLTTLPRILALLDAKGV